MSVLISAFVMKTHGDFMFYATGINTPVDFMSYAKECILGDFLFTQKERTQLDILSFIYGDKYFWRFYV